MKLEEIVKPLLDWYQKNKRILPWRSDPTAYHVWISEIMLQQTRVEAVKTYYQRFLTEIPDLHTLATISEDRLLKLWEGLGYYNRARNLQKAAIILEKEYQGIFPRQYEELLKLPGIGEYTAGAIASISFQEKVPAVDGNVFRVILRVLGSSKNISKPATKKWLQQQLQEILPEEVGDFNQALMELGALVCLPNGMPLCDNCPLASFCQARQDKTIAQIPVKDVKRQRKVVPKTIFVLVHYDQVAIEKRPATGLLSNLWQLPNKEGYLSRTEVEAYLKKMGLSPLRILPLASSKHIFTHLEWQMKGFLVFVPENNTHYTWVNYQDLKKDYALPTAFKKYEEELKEAIKGSK